MRELMMLVGECALSVIQAVCYPQSLGHFVNNSVKIQHLSSVSGLQE